MESTSKISSVSFVAIQVFCFCTMFFGSSLAQSGFSRNDGYDFTGAHHLSASGSNPDHFNLLVDSDSDFRRFKLHINKSRLTLGPRAIANRYRVDMNSDGTWEQNWTNSDEMTISTYYPNPPNGISSNQTIKIEIEYMDYDGQTYPSKTKYQQVTVFSTPRVYVSSENDAFVQLRDEDCSAKKPVLMVEGFDPPNEKFPEVYYNLTWDLVNSDLYPNGYEVFILNFHDGGRDLRPNAEVLMKAIEKIHEICPNYRIVVAGLSMGGPITRYALAKKEGESGVHNVGLFLSYDSPQQWAHVSPDLQDWIRIQNSNEGAIGDMQYNLQSVAAKQMLGYDTYDPAHILRDQFYNNLNTLNGDGYPHQSYNVSVSNGNFNATWGYESIGRHMMTLKINDVLVKDVPAVAMDCGTGSMITDIRMKRYGDIFNNPLVRIYYELEIIFNPAYTPTWSALNLVGTQINDITGDIVSFDHSKFDDYVVQTVPLQHHELSALTRSKIVYWLGKHFNIGVDYALLDGGSASTDNYQVRILHGIPITVQPKTVNAGGQQITYNFASWEDRNTNNPRTFYASHDISHTAIMKGHLLSATATVTGPNNQRKIILDVWGKYHLVYASSGEIWYTTSSDGVTWEPEVRVSDGFGSNVNPSICYTNSTVSNYVRIVWVNTSGKAVYYREGAYNPPDPNPVWHAIERVSQGLPVGSNAELWTPVVSDHWVVYNEIYSGGTVGEIKWHKKLSNGTWTIGSHVPTSDISSVHPTIGGTATKLCVAFEQASSGQIMYNELTGLDGPFTWAATSSFVMNNGSGLTNNAAPSLSLDDCEGCSPSNVFVAWHGWNGTSNKNEILVRRKQFTDLISNWGSSEKFVASLQPFPGFSNPVISSAGNGDMSLVWWASDNSQRAAKFKTYPVNSWGSSYRIGSSANQYVALSNGFNGIGTRVLQLNGSTAPYTLTTFALPSAPQITCSVLNGWNMTSIPLAVRDFAKAAVYPTAISSAFGYNSGYIATDQLTNDKGWYIKFGSDQNITYEGDLITHMPMVAIGGWNIIGSISSPVSVANIYSDPPGIVMQPFYRYQNGYIPTSVLQPGGGYWVRTSMSGGIMLSAIPEPSISQELDLQSYDRFTITDAVGGQQELYVRNGEIIGSTEDIEMPPPPPDSLFDVRFSSGDLVKTVLPDSGATEISISLSDVVYPVELTWVIRPENGIRYSMLPDSGSGLGKTAASMMDIHDSSSMVLSHRGNGLVQFRVSSTKDGHHQLPAQYALHQNYPNPFNPSTTIKYELPIDCFVVLKLFDVVGREVMTLAALVEPAGYHEVVVDASHLASGLYFYRIQAGGFVSTRKMVLVK